MHSDKQYCVYIMASRKNGYFYTGVTNDLIRRVYEHKEGKFGGYTDRHHIKRLVYYEIFEQADAAIAREKLIKKWKRVYKTDAIERMNPNWKDLYDELTQITPQSQCSAG